MTEKRMVDLDKLKKLAGDPSTTIKSIILEFKISYDALNRIMVENNIELARCWCPNEEELYGLCDKKTIKEIAKEHGLTPKSLGNHLKKKGISYRNIQRKKLTDLKPKILKMLEDGATAEAITLELGWNSKQNVSYRLRTILKLPLPKIKRIKHKPRITDVDITKLNESERIIYEKLSKKYEVFRCDSASCDFFLKPDNIIVEVKSGSRSLQLGIIQLLYGDFLFKEHLDISPKGKMLVICKVDKANKRKLSSNKHLYTYFIKEHNIAIVDENFNSLF